MCAAPADERSTMDVDDPTLRKAYLNGFAPGSIMEADLIDHFGALFNGHIRGTWIDRKHGTHAMIEFDDEQWAKRAIDQRKHYIGDDRLIVFAWKATKGTFSKRDKKKERPEGETDKKSISSEIDRNRIGSMEGFSMRALHDSKRLNEAEASRRQHLINDLEKQILDIGIWPPEAKLVLFGSTVSGFGWRASDIDMTLLVDYDIDRSADLVNGDVEDHRSSDDQYRLTMEEYRRLDPKASLELLASCLREVDASLVSDIVQIHGHRCPVVRFSLRDQTTKAWIRCEISIDNEHATKKSRRLQRLTKEYEWLAVLYSTFRWWIGQWKELEKAKKELNGYTMSLMLIAYCQQRGLIDQRWAEDTEGSPDAPSSTQLDEAALSDLFHQFFTSLHKVHLKQTVFSPAIRDSDQPVIPILDFLKSSRHHEQFQFADMNVQDPFDLDHNTANHVSEDSVKRLKMVSAYWTKKVERVGGEEVWKVLSTDHMEPDWETEEKVPAFICEPSVDTLLKLLALSSENVGGRWCDTATKAVLDVFSEVLKMRVAEEDPGSKKFYCLAWHATWLTDKRKAAWQKMVESQEAGIGVWSWHEMEKRISEAMVAEEETKCAGSKKKKKKPRVEPVAEFTLTLEVKNEDGWQEVSGRLEGEKHLTVFERFLADFMPLVFEDAVRKVMVGEDEEAG